MRKLCTVSVVSTLIVTIAYHLVWADGIMLPNEFTWKQMRERALINEPEQKAVVFYRKGVEDLIISPSYEGPTSSFAWVIPVPARPKVEIMKGAIFHELAELTMPKPKRDSARDVKVLSPGTALQAVTVLERKTVGAYDVSVLSATDDKALVKWLKANRYQLPEKAAAPISSYIKEGWTFVACRIKAPESAKGLRTGTLAPLRLSFKAKQPVYPMRMSSANPKPFSVLIYLIRPRAEVGNRSWISLTSTPYDMYNQKRTIRQASLGKGQRKYPTLAKLSKEELQVFVHRAYPRPEHCTKDYCWQR